MSAAAPPKPKSEPKQQQLGSNSSLSFADPQPREHLAILLYGPTGAGKSVAAAGAPGPIVYCNADGPGALRYARRATSSELLELAVDGRRPLDELALELRDGKLPEVGTVVLDSLGRIYDVVLDEIAHGGKPSLPHRLDANTYIERYVLQLLELPVHLVLVAHDNPVVVTGSEEDGTQSIELYPHTGTNNPSLAKKLMRPLDIVAYCARRTVKDEKSNETREEFVAQTVNAKGRHGKDRTDVLPAVAPLDLQAWITDIHAAYQPVSPKSQEEKN